MASYTTIQGVPLEIDFTTLINDNGWSFSGGFAIHESCNAGSIQYSETFLANADYRVSIQIESLTAGILRIDFGNTSSNNLTTTGFIDNIILNSTTANPKLSVYSDANAKIKVLTIKKEPVSTDLIPNNTDTIVFSKEVGKWIRYDNYHPDCGNSLFANLITYKDGVMSTHSDRVNRNTFYGNEYKSRIKAHFVQPKVVTFQNLKIEANRLIITETDGIETSLGQVSDLIAQDFEQFILDDGVTTLTVYDSEGNYTAEFLRDKVNGEGINFGDRLKGRYITVNLTTTDEQDFQLYKVSVKYSLSTPNE